jgi:hypothetical protein
MQKSNYYFLMLVVVYFIIAFIDGRDLLPNPFDFNIGNIILIQYPFFILLPILVGTLVFYLRNRGACANQNINKPYLTPLFSSIILHCFSDLFIAIIERLPVVGNVLGVLYNLPFIGMLFEVLLKSGSAAALFTFINLGNDKNLGNYCANNADILKTIALITFAVSSLFFFGKNFLKSVPIIGFLINLNPARFLKNMKKMSRRRMVNSFKNQASNYAQDQVINYAQDNYGQYNGYGGGKFYVNYKS